MLALQTLGLLSCSKIQKVELRMAFQFVHFDAKKSEATEAAWRGAALGQDVFPGDVDAALNIAKKFHANGAMISNGVGYGVFASGEDAADAIVEVFLSRHGKRWLKMMSCTLAPSVQQGVYSGEPAAQARALDVYATALAGVLSLHSEHNAAAVRIYGRHDIFLDFLKNLAKTVNAKGIGEATVDVQGRWLVVNP